MPIFVTSIVKTEYSTSISLEQSLTFKASSGDSIPSLEAVFVKFPIPKAGFKLPNIIKKALNKILPSSVQISREAGLFIVSIKLC